MTSTAPTLSHACFPLGCGQGLRPALEVIQKVDSFVADYAKAKGFQLIIGTSGKGTVMYGDEKMNVTADILDLLNKDYSKE